MNRGGVYFGPDLDYYHPIDHYRRVRWLGIAPVTIGDKLMGTPDTYDVCGSCGEAIIQVNNTGNWLHVETINKDPRSTDCKVAHVKQNVASKSGWTVASNGRAKKRGT